MTSDPARQLRPLHKKTVTEAVLEQIAALIRDGVWKPGDKLPSERELAETLRVSRSSVREALKTLEFMGYVKVQSGEGTFVTTDTSNTVTKAMLWAVSLTPQNLIDLIATRQLIEPYLAAQAARRITADELAQLHQYVQVMSNSLYRSQPYIQADYDFHQTIALASHNRILFHVFQTIRELLEEFIEQILTLPGAAQTAHDDHTRILTAIETRDSATAETAMREHLDYIHQRLLQVIPSE